MNPLNTYFDHTLLRADASLSEIRKLCSEAMAYDFYAVCVNGCYVSDAVQFLTGSSVKVAAVVGFPLGTASTETKCFEADDACARGADEIDMVINIGALKEGREQYVLDEIAAVVAIADEYDSIVKVIIETCLLTDEEIVKACRLCIDGGAAFVKTSTGFSTGGATPHDIKLIKQTVGDAVKIKASGGIRDILTTREMINLGADRIGCSSSVAIMQAVQ